jgi:formyltetrahydrofolate deformylase
MRTYTLSLTCDDRPGIVAAVTAPLAALGGNITESSQYWDRRSNTFFMRVGVSSCMEGAIEAIQRRLGPICDQFSISLSTSDDSIKPKIIIMVSRFDHAMLHLLYQIKVGWLPAEVVAIVSNHEDCRSVAEHEGIPFFYWPTNAANKAQQEEKLLALAESKGVDAVILARYMQVLSDATSRKLFGRVINIHHSFLPSFKGAKPYHQAYERGVKIIGATAHYVTPELDEGPIIEQETQRVTHSMSVDELIATGRDIESRVLARAVKLYLERRVMLCGARTVVFAN